MLFYILLYNFINCPALQTLNKLCITKQQESKYNQRDVYFLCIVPYVCFVFLRWIKFFSGCFRQAFFDLGDKKKWSLVHSSTKYLVPPLHKFTIQNLDLIFSLFGKLNPLKIAVYLLTCQYFGRMGKKLSLWKVGLHFADFSQFELRRYAMKGKSEGNFQDVFFIVHRNDSTHMFLLQVLG